MIKECELVKRLAPYVIKKEPPWETVVFNPTEHPADEDMEIVAEWFKVAQHTPEDQPLPIDGLFYRAAEAKGGLSTADILQVAGAFESFMKGRFFYAMMECSKKPE